MAIFQTVIVTISWLVAVQEERGPRKVKECSGATEDGATTHRSHAIVFPKPMCVFYPHYLHIATCISSRGVQLQKPNINSSSLTTSENSAFTPVTTADSKG